jgi:hypothetical protein
MTTAAKVLSVLNLTPNPSGKYRINSPLRQGSDSTSFALTIHGDEHGVWTDHAGNESGTLYDLAKRIGVELPSKGVAVDTMTATTFEEFAEQHGVSVDVYKAAGWVATTYQSKPAIAFSTKTGTRYRLLSGKQKYAHRTGYQSSWYKLSEAIELTKTGAPLVLCNGEASTVPAQSHGVPATCITGGSERAIPESLLTELLEGHSGHVVIALDCDDKGRAAARKLHSQLKTAGYAVKVVNLGLSDKGDLADYLRLWTPKELYALPDITATELVVAVPKTLTAAELQAVEVPPLRYLIDDLMVPGCYLLAGAPKSRKSFAALHMAIAVASGGMVFSRFETTQSGVLYLDLEMSQNSVHRRISQMLQQEHKAWPKDLHFGFGDDWSYRGAEASAQLEAWLNVHMDVRLVIIDVLAQWREQVDPRTPVYTADYDALKHIQRVANKRQITIMVVHHTNKAKMSKGDNPFDKISGSTGIQGAVDAMWLLTRNPDDPYATILQMTDRNIADVDKLELGWDDYLGAHTVDPKLRMLQSSSAERQAIYKVLQDHMQSMTPSDIANALGKSDAQIKKLLPRLAQDKLIEKVGYGRYKATYIDNGYSGNSSYYGNSGNSGNSVDQELPNSVGESDQELPRVTESNQRVTGGFSALESAKPMKSNQSDRYYIEISRVLSDGKAYTPTYILSQVERQPKWNDVKAVLNTMIDDEIVVWNDDQTKLFIPTSAKRS